MFKRIALVVSIILFSAPVFASASTGSANSERLIALYTQLVQLLQQELALLQNPTHVLLSITPTYGTAPLTAIFILTNRSDTEAVDFGDGHSSGSNGCVKNALGYCDLSKPLGHTYQFPGTYTVTLYNHPGDTTQIVSTAKVTVGAPAAKP